MRLLIDQCVYTPYYQSRFPSRQRYHTSYVCPRLSCAHDGPSTYVGIVKNLRVKAKILAYCIGLPRVQSQKTFGDLPPRQVHPPGRLYMHTNSQAYAEPGLYSIPYVIGCKLGGTENSVQVRSGAIALSNSGVSVSLDQLSTNGVFDGVSVVRGHLKPPRPLALPVHFNLYVWPPPAKLRQKHHCRWSYHTGGCHFLLHLPRPNSRCQLSDVSKGICSTQSRRPPDCARF